MYGVCSKIPYDGEFRWHPVMSHYDIRYRKIKQKGLSKYHKGLLKFACRGGGVHFTLGHWCYILVINEEKGENAFGEPTQ